MKKCYYEETPWYNEGVYNSIMSLDAKYPNAIPVFGGALGAYDLVDKNFDHFVSKVIDVADDAKFYGWHEGAVGAMRRFCRICLVDPALVEAYLGVKFEEVLS